MSLIGCGHFNNDLFDAITKNDIASVDHLIRKGVDINKKDVEGRTPLFLASLLGECTQQRKAESVGICLRTFALAMAVFNADSVVTVVFTAFTMV